MKFRRFQLSCLALSISSGIAMAGSPDTSDAAETPSQPPYYVNLHGGISLPDDTDIAFAFQNLRGVPGKGTNDEGYRIGGTLGVNFNELLSGEVEVSYTKANVSSIFGGNPVNTTVQTSGNPEHTAN